MQTFSKANWLSRFGRRLMRLHPSMTAVSAAGHSINAWRAVPDVEPESAAEMHPGAPSQETPVKVLDGKVAHGEGRPE
jgi:hypothetical protein